MQRQSESKAAPIKQDPMVPHNMKGKDIIRAQDFNYLMVLGKGSFGKVGVCSIKLFELEYCEGDASREERNR